MTGQPMTDNASSASPLVSKSEAKPRQPNGEPAKGDASWPFSSPAATKDAARPHEIDLYIEASPRDSPTALPKLFTTLEPEPLAQANAHVEEDLSSTPPARESPPTLPSDTAPARAKPPARTVEFYQASPGVADVEFFVEEDDAPAVHEPMTYDEVMRRRRPPPAPAPAASDLVPAWLSNYWS
jgi:hypothetical protein